MLFKRVEADEKMQKEYSMDRLHFSDDDHIQD